MSSFDVSHTAAKAALEEAWKEIKSSSRPPAKMQQYIEEVLNASDVTYKYILVTGFLAKYINSKVHARALQKGSDIDGAYDARSLCHDVVVRFEKSKGNLFGLSNEPFVNKPARHPVHDKNNTQLRNRVIAAATHNALEKAQDCSRDEVFQGLVHILRVGAQTAAKEKKVTVTTTANLKSVRDFVREFLEKADGGARLVGVWGAFTALLYENQKVTVNSPNAADLYSKTAGDVEVRSGKDLISASECKQRPLNLDDVKHGIKKAKEKGVPEYLFVTSEGMKSDDEKEIKELVNETDDIDAKVIDIHKVTSTYGAMLGPLRRAKFGLEVVRLLRDMRKFDSANAAADLWNDLTDQDSSEE